MMSPDDYDEKDDPLGGIVPCLRGIDSWVRRFQILFWCLLTLIFISYLAFLVLP